MESFSTGTFDRMVLPSPIVRKKLFLILNAVALSAIGVLLLASWSTVGRFVTDRHLLAEARQAQERPLSDPMQLNDWLGKEPDSQDPTGPLLVLVTSPARSTDDPILASWESLSKKLHAIESNLRIVMLVVGSSPESESWLRHTGGFPFRVSIIGQPAQFKARLGITVVPFTLLTDDKGRIRRAAAGALGSTDADWIAAGLRDPIPRFKNDPDLTVIVDER